MLLPAKLRITKPTLIVDKAICIRNIQKIADKAKKHNLIFRPHFKTHQSIEIGNWFKDFNVTKITVSSAEMALFFANAGWKDILIAFPVNILEIDEINKLASKINLSLLVESIETIHFLEKHLNNSVNVYIKIDTGNHRTGIDAENIEDVKFLCNEIDDAKNLNLTGLLAHSGNTYNVKSKEEVLNIHNDSVSQLNKLKKALNRKDLIISIGDTPSCSLSDNFEGVDEIRPGNFVFYDVMQYQIGSCNTEEIAVSVACPVVAKHNERNEIVIYGGAVHFSKDFTIDTNGNKTFGLVVMYEKNSWSKPLENCFVKSISQEHGIVKVSSEYFDKIQIGYIIGILPVHSCLTMDLFKSQSVEII